MVLYIAAGMSQVTQEFHHIEDMEHTADMSETPETINAYELAETAINADQALQTLGT